jgi:protein TonB
VGDDRDAAVGTREEPRRSGDSQGAQAAAARQPEGEIYRVGGEVTPPQVVSRASPEYTEAARRARVNGIVILEAVVDKQGDVVRTRVLKGLPMGLDQAAVDAVTQWKFSPATRNGKPVAVYFILTVNFRTE